MTQKNQFDQLVHLAQRSRGEKNSCFLPIKRSGEALDLRLGLSDSAQTTLDAQYYIWKRDETGYLLVQRLLQAADRGVKVRLLLDDVKDLSSKGTDVESIRIDDQEFDAIMSRERLFAEGEGAIPTEGKMYDVIDAKQGDMLGAMNA